VDGWDQFEITITKWIVFSKPMINLGFSTHFMNESMCKDKLSSIFGDQLNNLLL
jgi:hypothetical protein